MPPNLLEIYLLTGKMNASPEEALAAFSSWLAVHGSSSNYTRMALCLVDNHFRKTPATAAPLRSPLFLLRRSKDLTRTHPHHTSPGWSPVCLSRLCPASGPLHASRRLKAASCPSLASPGAAPEAANEAAAPLPPREAPVAVRGPPAAEAAEAPFCVCSHNSRCLFW
jgi:hypothetical protein